MDSNQKETTTTHHIWMYGYGRHALILGVQSQIVHWCLQVIEGIVNKLGSRGIYTILDCHQDLMSPKFCGNNWSAIYFTILNFNLNNGTGEGFPDYASLYNESFELGLFPIPIPSLIPFQINKTTGYSILPLSDKFLTLRLHCRYPYRSECEAHLFADYYASYACCKAWYEYFWIHSCFGVNHLFIIQAEFVR